MEDEQKSIVIDNGTGMIKAGIAENEKPECIFPCCVGSPKHTKTMFSKQNDDDYVGDKIQKFKGLLKLNYPMKHGVINEPDTMVRIWEHVYLQLSTQPSEHPVLLTEAPLNPKKHRREIMDTFFNKFNVPSLLIAEQAILSLYASARITGVVLDSGHGVTHCVPVFEGFAIPHAISRMDVAGAEVNEHLNYILKKNGFNFHTSAEMQTVQDLKEKVCCVRKATKVRVAQIKPRHFLDEKKKKHKDFSNTMESALYYALPDGRKVFIREDIREGPAEILFNPSLIGQEYSGVHNCVATAIEKSDLDLRCELWTSIVLSGGSTMFKGFGDRMLQELSKLTDAQVKIFAPANRTLSTWVGGSILAPLDSVKDMWVTREQFQDEGSMRRHLYMHSK